MITKDIQENIFSVPIWGLILSDHKYESKDYIKCLKELQKTSLSVKKSNFGGYQSEDNLHLMPVFRELTIILKNKAKLIISEYTGNDHIVQLSELWGNINTRHSFNFNHTHGGVLSGVFYLQTPANCGRLVFKNPAVRSDISLIRAKDFVINPEPLGCIFFPSWLEHYVEPNSSDEERISLSFNFEVM